MILTEIFATTSDLKRKLSDLFLLQIKPRCNRELPVPTTTTSSHWHLIVGKNLNLKTGARPFAHWFLHSSNRKMVSSALLQRPLVCECVLIMYNSSKAADARHQYRHLVIRSTLLVKYLIPRGTNAVSINHYHTSLSQCDCERTPNRSPEQLLHVRTYTRACYTINNFLTNFRTPLQNRLFCASESTSTALSSFALVLEAIGSDNPKHPRANGSFDFRARSSAPTACR